MSLPILTDDFATASARHRGDMAYLRSLVTELRAGTFLTSIPVYDKRKWWDSDVGNCTAFAFDSPHNDRMQPGFLGTGKIRYNRDRPKMHKDYAADIHQSILRDEVIYVGENLRKAIHHGVPAAVFYRGDDGNEDYHWYTLRRSFNPAGNAAAELNWMNRLSGTTSVSREPESIFDHAGRNGYKVFGGYYGIPLKLIGK